MHRFTQQAVILFTLLTLPPAVWADRTYNILNYPDLQNGWTLSGTITTDGTIGTIQPTNILSWTWTITSGVSSFTVSSTDQGAVAQDFGGMVIATCKGLFVPYSNENVGYPNAGFGLVSDTVGGLGWYTGPKPQISLTAWLDVVTTGLAGIGTADPGSWAWQIASPSPVAVPEPSSLYIAGFGAVCGCVYVMGHKRRARRTATTDA